jgi:invasion protein IalB
MKLFRWLFNTTILNSLITDGKNLGHKIDHFQFRTDFIVGLLVKYSTQHIVPGQKGDDNAVKRLTEWHFSQRTPSTEKKSKPRRWCIVCSKHKKRKETMHYCQH